ncbi:MAG: hypothetical protein AAB893_02835, partial [Patescibacteria group bacterium]
MKATSPLPHSELQIERMLTIWGIIVIIWSFFRAYLQPPVWFSEFIAKPMVFLLPILFYIKRFEPKERFFLSAVGFPHKKKGLEL